MNSLKVSNMSFSANFNYKIKCKDAITNHFFPYSVLNNDIVVVKNLSQKFSDLTKGMPGDLTLEKASILQRGTSSLLKLKVGDSETLKEISPATTILNVNELVKIYKKMLKSIKKKV